MLFEVDNYIYDVKKQPAESDKYHNTKGNFIASLKPIDDDLLTKYQFNIKPKKLKIGFVSGNFRQHPVGFFLLDTFIIIFS